MTEPTKSTKVFVIFVALLVGCGLSGGERKAYIVFIDYTKSASTFITANKEKVEDLI